MSKQYRIRVTGKPREEMDVDLLVQAILAIAAEQPVEEQVESDTSREESA